MAQSLKEAAIASCSQAAERQQSSDYQNAKQQLKDLEQVFGRSLETAQIVEAEFFWYAPVKTHVVEVDGLQFSSRSLIGTCDQCNQRTLSDELYGLSDLGRLLDKFTPGVNHRYSCP